MSSPRIDVHHHVFPPAYLDKVRQLGLNEGGGISFPEWSAAADLEMMDRHGIQTAMVSIASPGVYFGDSSVAYDLSRTCNEFMAELVREHPTRFGMFASVPLPSVADAIAEANYAFDTLKCDGIALMGDVGDRFLGDPEFEEFMRELNRRSAVVFIHPNVHSSSQHLGLKFPAALFEFLADTTRAVLNLVLSGTTHRYPNIRFILSHAGGAVACHAWRWALADRSPIVQKNAPNGVLSYIRKLYFDTALSPSRYAMRPVMDLAGPGQILFGSDFPYVHGDVLNLEMNELDRLDVFDETSRKKMSRTNAQRLFPRLGSP